MARNFVFAVAVCSVGLSEGDNSVTTPSPTVFDECSEATCAELQWNSASYGSSAVCGETDADVLGGECLGAATWSDARRVCQAAGARLCTSSELELDEARGTGCNFDSELIWSSTACGTVRPYKDKTYWAVYGSTVTGLTSECLENTIDTTVRVRCCADLHGCTAKPSPEPTFEGQTPSPSISSKPTIEPSPTPTHFPTRAPTSEPTPPSPTALPTPDRPTSLPSSKPTKEPTPSPTNTPTHAPTHLPSEEPTQRPTPWPTHPPSRLPTKEPTPLPSDGPNRAPTLKPVHSAYPSPTPTHDPTDTPTSAPTTHPSGPPSHDPTSLPSTKPSPSPTHYPTSDSWVPTHIPTMKPSPDPSLLPSQLPTQAPTPTPTHEPTLFPTKVSKCSSLSCSQLGWEDNAALFGRSHVCGGTEIGGECPGVLSFEAAREFCQSKGARLCEAHELLSDEARDTGCASNGQVVWSDTSCANNQRRYYVTYGSTDGDRQHHDKPGTFGRQCKTAIGQGAELFHARCCADQDPVNCAPSTEPTPLPTPSPSPAPTFSPPTPAPTAAPSPAPTIVPLTCASPAALYQGLVGQTSGEDYTCSQVEVSEVSGGLAQRFCNFSPGECADGDLWETCTFNVRSSPITIHAPPSYNFQKPPSVLFCTQGCHECLAK